MPWQEEKGPEFVLFVLTDHHPQARRAGADVMSERVEAALRKAALPELYKQGL